MQIEGMAKEEAEHLAWVPAREVASPTKSPPPKETATCNKCDGDHDTEHLILDQPRGLLYDLMYGSPSVTSDVSFSSTGTGAPH